jgi:arylsulfatase A-like enzyme
MALLSNEGGFPLAPLIGHDGSRPDAPIAELVQKPWGSDRFPAFHGAMQSVVDGPWHYIRHDVFGVELYDLDADLAALRDLAADPEQAERIAHLDSIVEVAWQKPRRAGRPE